MSADIPIFKRQSDLYHAEYGAFIRRTSKAGAVDLLELSQTAGDFSDQPSGDLQLIRCMSRAQGHTDFGSGKFSHWSRREDFVLSPPRFANSIVIDQAHRLQVACIPWQALRSTDVDDRLPRDGHFGEAHRRANRDQAMSSMIDRLWEMSESEGEPLAAEQAMTWIADRLIQWMTWPDIKLRKPAEKLAPRALAMSKQRLEADGTQSVTLTELASLCGLSPFHFCRAFKAATGLPPHRYQIVARMERARNLLLNPRMTIAEAGSAVGYDDPAYFSRLFARETGTSPSNWRREALK
jgi:AraC family transcriptional regulator